MRLSHRKLDESSLVIPVRRVKPIHPVQTGSVLKMFLFIFARGRIVPLNVLKKGLQVPHFSFTIYFFKLFLKINVQVPGYVVV